MKKILAWALLIVLTASISVGATLAYLTDTDEDVNVMTVGNVQIEQIEQEWNGDRTELVDFTQAKPLYPYVGTLGWENTEETDGAYRRFTMNNVVDKYVSVKNTGKSPAYVRTFIALEMGDYSYEEFNMIGVSINKMDGSEFQFEGAWEWTDDFVAEIDGKNYNIMVAVHKDPVAPGETTIPSLLQVYLSKDATNEVCEKLDGNGNGTYDILVFSQAVQTAGFADAQTALNEAFGTEHPWQNGNNADVRVVFTAEELRDAIADEIAHIILGDDISINKVDLTNADGGDVKIDARNHTITIEPSDSGIRGVHIEGPGREITIMNANIVCDDTESTNSSDIRGVSLNRNTSGSTINIINCSIKLADDQWSFGVNIISGITNSTVNIDGCTIVASAPVKIFAADSTVNISNSTLICNSAQDEDYSLCIRLQDNSKNITLNVENCHFDYQGGIEMDYACAIFNSGTSNVIHVTNCTYGSGIDYEIYNQND